MKSVTMETGKEDVSDHATESIQSLSGGWEGDPILVGQDLS